MPDLSMGFRFANPSWAIAMWLVPLFVIALVWLDERGRSALDRFLSPVMQSRLVRRLSRTRRWLAAGFVGLAIAALILAAMRPQWGLTFVKTPRVGAQIMICLDVSNSMLAADTAPNRLERAKAEIKDLLSYLNGDQVGLIGFAGKATVLCPLTTDYGFLTLALDEAGPHSAGRGGTQLEAPLRQALAGFRGESMLSRVILLITDGEDHGSFPLDAAKEAAQRGIKVITIGFGDEAGSEIELTDPVTGAKTKLRDGEGKIVRTQLDGELLRDIAVTTQAAYIPAGTGALDLESIYDAHIAPLVRGDIADRGRAVRREGYQWALLVALVFLLTAIALGSRRTFPFGASRGAMLGCLAVTLTVTSPAMAQDSSQPPESSESAEEKDPLSAYNEAVGLIKTEADQADRLLTKARRAAATDGEVRFRASYNLGWLEVQRANQLLENQQQKEPEKALEHLVKAADWFRDAIRLRPDHRDSRHNLEVVLRRILQLNDSLRKQNAKDLAAQLDELIQRQRDLSGEIGALVEQTSASADLAAPDRFRSDFRQLAIRQRALLGDASRAVETAHEELDALKAKREKQAKEKKQLPPAELVRMAQLSTLLEFSSQALQRMGQTRSQLRRRQSDRAFRRSAAALDDLKRARNQLRNPVEVLGVLIADAVSLVRQTRQFTSEEISRKAPSWLSREYLHESQQRITDRTAELAGRLSAVSAQQPDANQPKAQQPDAQQSDPRTERLLERIRQAAPLIAQAKDAFQAAQDAWPLAAQGARPAEEDQTAVRQQQTGVKALMEAAELFFDIRRQIEVMVGDHALARAILTPEEEGKPIGAKNLEAQLPAALEIQQRNLQRASRLAEELAFEHSQIKPNRSTYGAAAPNQAPQNKEEEQQRRLETAQQILGKARAEITKTRDELAEFGDKIDPATEEGKSKMAAVQDSMEETHQHLTALRRLFFTLAEHLRETAQRQAQLNDDTQRLAADPNLSQMEDQAKQEKAGPLGERQRELQTITEEISQGLKEQAAQKPPQPTNTSPGQNPQSQAAETTRRLSEAADHVDSAVGAMKKVDSLLQAQKLELKPATEAQNEALENLLKALALLTPPQQNQQQDPSSGDDQQNQQQQQQDQNKNDQDRSQPDPRRGAALLQAVRDREAKRRKERAKRQAIPTETVEKNW